MAPKIDSEIKAVAAALPDIERQFILAYNGIKGLVKGAGKKMFQVYHGSPRQLLNLEEAALEGHLRGMVSKAGQHGIIPSRTPIHGKFHELIDEMRSLGAQYRAAVPQAPVPEMYTQMGTFAERLKLSSEKVPLQQAEAEFLDAYQDMVGFVKGHDRSMHVVNHLDPRAMLRAKTPETFEGYMLGMMRKAEKHGVVVPQQESFSTFTGYIDRLRDARTRFLQEAKTVSLQQASSGPAL